MNHNTDLLSLITCSKTKPSKPVASRYPASSEDDKCTTGFTMAAPQTKPGGGEGNPKRKNREKKNMIMWTHKL